MPNVSVIAKITAQEGKRDDLIAALQAAFVHVDDEAGTIYYILHTDDSEANLLWMYELYADQAALVAHSGSAWFKAWGPTLAPFMAARPVLTFVTPVAGKGL